MQLTGTWIDRKPAAGNYTYKLQWSTDPNVGATTSYTFLRTLTVGVFPDE